MGYSSCAAEYAVNRSRFLPAVFPDELLIDPSQVVSLDSEHMVVDDTLAPITAAEAEQRIRRAVRPAGLSNSLRE